MEQSSDRPLGGTGDHVVIKEGVAKSPRTRPQEERPSSSPSQNAQESKKKARKRKKPSPACPGGEDADVKRTVDDLDQTTLSGETLMETSGQETQTTEEAGGQEAGGQPGDPEAQPSQLRSQEENLLPLKKPKIQRYRVVHAHTQTSKRKARSWGTQTWRTQAVNQCSQATQFGLADVTQQNEGHRSEETQDMGPTPGQVDSNQRDPEPNRPDETAMSESRTAETQSSLSDRTTSSSLGRGNAGGPVVSTEEKANPKESVQKHQDGPSGKSAIPESQSPKDALPKPASYAQAVTTGTAKVERRSGAPGAREDPRRASQSEAERELPQKGHLLEASYSMEDREVPRGQALTYMIVLELIDLCVRLKVSEVLLLVPLLHKLRQPADAPGMGPTVEEEKWSGLDMVKFCNFRDNIVEWKDKRNWLALVAFEDIPEFSDLTGVGPGHLIQALLYRLRQHDSRNNTAYLNEQTPRILTHIIAKVEMGRVMDSGEGGLSSVFLSSIDVVKSACKMARLVPCYRTVLQSYQLVLKLALIIHPKQALDAVGGPTQALDAVVAPPRLWMLWVDCTDEEVLLQWRSTVEKDLRKRITQRQKEGDLMQTLASKVKDIPSGILSSIIVKSAARFDHNPVLHLLDPHSAVSFILSEGWKALQVDDVAGEIVRGCEDRLASLVDSLIVGHVALGDLKTTLKHKDQFKKLYHHYQRSRTLKSIPDGAEGLLARRLKDLNFFLQQQSHVDTLMKMFAKVTESITEDYLQHGMDIARATITFGRLDRALVDTGDQGDGELMKRELSLMAKGMCGILPSPEDNWVEKRLCQIQQYRQVLAVAAAARSVVQIATQMELSGDFSEIHNLTQLKEDLFKQRTLDSLSSDLISATRHLSTITKQQTVCLDEFLKSHTLVTWVKNNLKNMGDVKVFVELASISAGENDTEIDQVAYFLDAVMGYGPLLYNLAPTAGFEDFMTCARLVWEAQHRDERLPYKLRCLQNLMCVEVNKGELQQKKKSYSLGELLELQNKLMLMSSKGEHGNQVRRFTEVFEEDEDDTLVDDDEAMDCSRLDKEVFPTTLSLYVNSPEQPLPSTDEVLVCREATTEEEVEIFFRRALGQGSKVNQKRIYSLVNPGLLGYEVSVALGELFDGMERSAGVGYRLVIVSPLVHQHRYVPSFFSNHKVQAGVTVTAETSRRYIHHHFTITDIDSPVSMISPKKLSVWVVSSQRPAVGKSLFVERLFQTFQQKSSLAQKITIRLIEPHIDIDSIIHILSDRLASVREQDPILLHIDTAAVSSGLEEFLFQLLVLRCLCDSQGTVWRRNLTHLFMIEVLKPNKPCPNQSKEVKLGLLDIFPTIQCRPPKEVHQLLLVDPDMLTKDFDPLMDKQEFFSEGIQRPYQYLKLFNSRQSLDPFKYQDVMGDPKDCLEYFLEYCGMFDPSSFRLVVVEDQKKVYEHFPVPLINRLEKHRVGRSTDLTPWQRRVLEKLEEWSFLENHLSTLQQSSRFLEVTTFSSLLTTSDIKTVACVLGLQSNRLLLLSLHQFDTEASFCSKIRSFLQDAEPSPHIVIVQMDLEEHCSVELIASAKYCTMNYLMSLGHPACCVVFIAKLSRIPSGPRYIGFQGGIWQSVHIDDLRDTEDMSLNLLAFSDTPDQAAYLHGLSLVRSCVQKAVGLLRDPSGGAAPARSVERIHTLLTLLRNGQDDTNARFQEVLLGRLAQALALREGTEVSPGEWLNAEARKRQALREGGTLRHTVWRCLQSRVTPVLASVVEVLDRGANLDLLLGGRLSPGLTGLWLDVFSDAQILDLTAPQTPSRSEQEILVQGSVVLEGEEQPCVAPFSWLIRGCLQSLWDESEFIPVASDDSAWRIQQFVSAFDNSPLGAYLQKLSEQEQVEYGHRFLHDFLLLSLKISTKAELRMFTKALSGCVSELQCNTAASCHLSPAWVMAAAKHYAPRLHTLSHTMLLQDQLPSEIYQLGTHRETSEMIEDILALGICVEKTKLLSVTSLEECKVFVRRVELLQPCLERALSHNYSALCGPGCLQHLNSMRWAWCGMLVIAAFIQRVLLEATQGDAGLKELALKHCSVLQRLMLEMPDLRNVVTLQQLIRILNSYDEESTGRTLRYGSQCAVCLSELKDPCLLPCEHVICMPCVQKCVSPDRRFCPKCRTDLPPDHQLTVSPDVTTALEKQAEVRASCNSFFLEVVSRFCLSEDQSPSAEVVELLFSLLISAHGDVYRTRELSPFLECVDNSPVVRSVLPKLLLQYSFDKVKVHIQSYLKNLEDNIMQGGDRTGLYLLFVNCFQDSLLCSEVEEAEAPGGRWRRLREECRFLSRLARRQTPDRQEDPAEFLLNMARLRRCLATAANALHTLLQASESTEESHESEQYLQQVRAVLDYCGHDWYRVYLLRALNRQANRDFILALMKDPRWRWVFPPEVLRLQSMVTLEVDPFLCVGPRYKALRDAVGQVLLEDRTDALQGELQKQTGPQAHAFLALALFREVARRCVSPDPKLRPSPQATATLEDLLKDRDMPETLRAFCTALLSNRIGGPGSSLSLGQGLPPGRRTLLELLVHQDSVLLAGDSLLAPLHRIAFQTASATRSFLPTMPDDHASEARQWLKEKKLQSFVCANGHLCFVGECGKPVDISKCPDCGVPIGGQKHLPVAGFQPSTQSLEDQTRTGHILGEAHRRSEAPERQMTPAQTGVLRLLTHLAMLQGAVGNLQAVGDMVHPTPRDVVSFLWSHLEQDVLALGRTLDLNADDTAAAVHLVLATCTELTPGLRGAEPDLTSRRGRAGWERRVCGSVIDPVLQNLKGKLAEARETITSDDSLAGSPLMRLLYGDPGPLLSLSTDPDCPTMCSAFWGLPETVTVERFSQLLGQHPGRSSLPLLVLFLQKISYIRQIQHLPELAALQSDLLKIFPLVSSDATSQSIGEMLHRLPAGRQSKVVSERVGRLVHVWNCLRLEMTRDPDLGLEVELCEKELTMDSSGGFLVPCRRGPGSCLRALVDCLSKAHNSLVMGARKLSDQESSDYSVPLEGISDTQLALCHPERQLLPLVLSHCHYTLKKGQETDSSYDMTGIQTQLARRFLAGKPVIRADTERFLNRHLQDFSVVLSDVRMKIPQNPLKGSVCTGVRSALRCYADACDAVFVVEIGLRFLGKTGGGPRDSLMTYLTQSLKIGAQISSSVAEALGESRLEHSVFIWQLLTCWKSELMLNRKQDPFQGLGLEYREGLTVEDRRGLNEFLAVVDTGSFSRELHEVLLLKTGGSQPDRDYHPHWEIRSTLETHLDQKNLPPLQGLEALPEDITLAKGADVWTAAVEFRRG
ncbi:hypothetical protein NHX12_025551 [Muraenolepis orangiensis]|uniref:E3 ubiquitin-protein ligase RNF213 n=1 Tax=Muraenolepis orangiensis TaxID=630683 RepID=A0A9Q0EK67_9TELE|nr:hypothetical protein NHX12_025551 [Muraenolepis orangiensis]